MSALTTGQRAVIGGVGLSGVSILLWGVFESYAEPAVGRAKPADPLVLKYPQITQDILSRVDGDGDGSVSPTEYALVGMEDVPFATFDRDGDGKMSAAEVEVSFLKESPSALLHAHAPPGP